MTHCELLAVCTRHIKRIVWETGSNENQVKVEANRHGNESISQMLSSRHFHSALLLSVSQFLSFSLFFLKIKERWHYFILLQRKTKLKRHTGQLRVWTIDKGPYYYFFFSSVSFLGYLPAWPSVFWRADSSPNGQTAGSLVQCNRLQSRSSDQPTNQVTTRSSFDFKSWTIPPRPHGIYNTFLIYILYV